MKTKGIFFFLFLCAVNIIVAQNNDSLKIIDLQKRIEILEKKTAANELKDLLKKAEETASEKTYKNETIVFKSGQRSLQAINPEISVTGDFLARYSEYKINEVLRTGFLFRGLGIHFASALDPFSTMKAAINFGEEGAKFGEGYITFQNVLSRISLTVGKFRQQFGIINRWHVHALDQVDFPLALTTILGPEGLNQTGISLDWFLPPLWADANDITLQITNGSNPQLFGGENFSFPVALFHLKNYYDLNENTYLEFGLTGMYGKNSYVDNSGRNLSTILAGADFTINWEPVNKAHYNMFELRSEIYFADKKITGGRIKAYGGYVYGEYKLNEFVSAGVRFDATQPFSIDNSGKYTYRISPYITWEQSHWVRLRFQYNRLNNNFDDSNILLQNDTALLQIVFAVGPHKHDRY